MMYVLIHYITVTDEYNIHTLTTWNPSVIVQLFSNRAIYLLCDTQRKQRNKYLQHTATEMCRRTNKFTSRRIKTILRQQSEI
jgi:hypothetical protein